MLGETISHYKIIEKLGEGGMGVVYRAMDTKLDRIVAIKFLPPHLSADSEAVKRFVHEAKAASAIDYSHIGTIYEIDDLYRQRCLDRRGVVAVLLQMINDHVAYLLRIGKLFFAARCGMTFHIGYGEYKILE